VAVAYASKAVDARAQDAPCAALHLAAPPHGDPAGQRPYAVDRRSSPVRGGTELLSGLRGLKKGRTHMRRPFPPPPLPPPPPPAPPASSAMRSCFVFQFAVPRLSFFGAGKKPRPAHACWHGHLPAPLKSWVEFAKGRGGEAFRGESRSKSGVGVGERSVPWREVLIRSQAKKIHNSSLLFYPPPGLQWTPW
jgi:hypothetical protein